MRTAYRLYSISLVFMMNLGFLACSKSGGSQDPSPIVQQPLKINSWTNQKSASRPKYEDVPISSSIRYEFSTAIDRSTASAITLKSQTGIAVPIVVTYQAGDSVIDIRSSNPLEHLTIYNLQVGPTLKSSAGAKLQNPSSIQLLTAIDSADKFQRVSDEELLNVIQRQTFKYFWENGHPSSGMARERKESGDLVTTGGTGFGIMSIVAAVHRAFITRDEGLQRVVQISNFLAATAERFHGAFSHWLNGTTGKVIPFSEKDNGADLVETSFLMQGLLSARQYFNRSDAAETTLRNTITALFNAVEWTAFVPAGSNSLYWHLSPDNAFVMNVPVKGWNEALITYVLAASSPNYPITRETYEAGWAGNGEIKNGNTYYNIVLPLGEPYGGPLFFSHYSFLGLDPNGLKDQYGDYEAQVKAHSKIHYNYALDNPGKFFGYGSAVWGLTASDDNDQGYMAHSITNDNGVISPTAAISSLPFTTDESMQAIRFYYYTLGDRLFGDYGFMDAFSLSDAWFSNSYLAIDQGPIIVMLENYRSGLLWNLFMSCPEVKKGLNDLGFTGPNI